MSKNIQNEDNNETQPKSQKGYSLRERTSTKKIRTISNLI